MTYLLSAVEAYNKVQELKANEEEFEIELETVISYINESIENRLCYCQLGLHLKHTKALLIKKGYKVSCQNGHDGPYTDILWNIKTL